MQPSSYLRPRGLSHPMAPVQPERAIDREERQGLVSVPLFSLLFFVFFLAVRFFLLCALPLVARLSLRCYFYPSPRVFFFPVLAFYSLLCPPSPPPPHLAP